MLLEGAKRRAAQMGLPCHLTLEDVRALWPADGKCPALGIPLKSGKDRKTLPSSPTLDRLNNDWGYEVGNVAIISMAANAAKRTLRAQELEAIAAWMRRMGLE
jgi:hypothetical protein